MPEFVPCDPGPSPSCVYSGDKLLGWQQKLPLEVFLTAGWIESFFSRPIWMGKTLWSSLCVGTMRSKENGAHQRTGVECPLASTSEQVMPGAWPSACLEKAEGTVVCLQEEREAVGRPQFFSGEPQGPPHLAFNILGCC